MKRKYVKQNESLLQVFDNVLPPNDKNIEETILGTILFNGDVIHEVGTDLSENLFFTNQNKLLCKLLVQLYKENKPIDFLMVSQKVKADGLVSELPNVYLMQLVQNISSSANFKAHFKILQEFALKRLTIQVCSKGIRDSYSEGADAFDLIGNLQTDIEDAIKNIANHQISGVGDIHAEIVNRSIELFKTKTKSGVPTGLSLVDNVTNGWQNSDLIILAGRPSMGKTATAICMSLHPALEEGIPIGIFSLEMSKEQLVSRMQSILSGVNVGRIVKKQLSFEEIEQIELKAKKLRNAPIFIDDTPSITIQDFKSKSRKMVKEFGCRMIVVDYLQLMRSGLKTHSREHEIAEISRSLKAVAKDLNVPIMALSQLSRAVESRGGDKKPLLSDLRESGQIEQDADMVCFCYRPEYYQIETYQIGNNTFDTNGLFMLIVAKHRNGELGEIPLRFIHEQTKIENHEFNKYPSLPQKAYEQKQLNSTFVQQDTNVITITSSDFVPLEEDDDDEFADYIPF
jgi:replicative DNA helicase